MNFKIPQPLKSKSFPVACIFGAAFLLAGMLGLAAANNHSVTLYAGQITTENIAGFISPDVEFADAYLVVGALAWTLKRFLDDALLLEVEGQVGKYFDDQKNWEFNLAIAGRWKKFPWNKKVKTSLAWGIGPSYATEVPKVEISLAGSSRQLLIYWFGEISLGPPKSNWAGVLRLHHRSPGFGLLGTKGGSNTLAFGLKYFFDY